DRAERRQELDAGDRNLLADRDRGQREARPAGGIPELPPALAGQPDPGQPAEAEVGDVAVVAIPAELEAHLDRPDVRRELENLAEREPAVLLPVVDRAVGDRDDALLAVEPVL